MGAGSGALGRKEVRHSARLVGFSKAKILNMFSLTSVIMMCIHREIWGQEGRGEREREREI